MKTMIQQLKFFTFSTMLTLGLCSSLLADDTEVYTSFGTLASQVRPNIIFIIDTSGSMNTDVTITTTNGTYDPGTTYTGSCSSSRVYWSDNGTPPTCSTNQYIDAGANTCSDSFVPLGSSGTGFYNGRMARYRSSRRGGDRWDTFSTSSHSDKVECKPDWGVHGENASSTDLYPADENNGGPWRATETSAINWDRTGAVYTLYSANYLNWRASSATTTTQTRLEIVQEVFADILNSTSDINIALMRFDDKSSSANDGGYFIMPMEVLGNPNRASYIAHVNAMTAGGMTPLSETMYEAYLYYRGDNVMFGNSTSPRTNVGTVLNGGQYVSPIEYQCQKNFVVLLTDGEPTYDTSADSAIESLSGFSTVTGASSCSGNCLDELAQYMYTKDCRDNLDGKQNVITYTIGFHTNQALLQNAATKGGGKYYTAETGVQLTDALLAILTEVRAINTTFTAPAVSVNAFNRLTHRDELYYALFLPDARPYWYGNIKRYQLDGNPPEIKDVNGALAVDPNTGFFADGTTSFWTLAGDAPDGELVKFGGAVGMIALPRTMYTYTGSTAPTNVDLTASSNQLHEGNSAITGALLGDSSMSSTLREEILKWARGVDLNDQDADGDDSDARRRMGSPLHTKPFLVTYGGTASAPDMTLYAGNNEGHLMAIDTDDGSEVFTFIPQELLPNLKVLYNNTAANNVLYGLDGPLTAWVNDANNNGILYSGGSLEADEFVYLYQGMRRGGSSYYALDVTDRSSPKLKWMITGGSGDFSELGQSWSSMTKAKVKFGGTDRDVLFFGGGYDVGQDTANNPQNDSIGRAIFMVDAETGAKLWQAGPSGSANGGDPDLVLSDMTNSIPSDLTILDTNDDGYADRIYVGDMRGQVWRFDINNDNGASDFVTGAVIARLGGSGPSNNRRFYYQPDVSLSTTRKYLNISIGSGYRSHPLDTAIHDAFYIIRDKDIYGPPVNGGGTVTYSTITESDLYDATDNIIGTGTEAQIAAARTALASKQGLMIWMKTGNSFVGEKVLAKSLTVQGYTIFSTYTPVAAASGACTPSQGVGRAYFISTEDGTSVYDFDMNGTVNTEDRSNNLVRGGIPPEPTLMITDDGPVILLATEKMPDIGLVLTPWKTYWRTE